jgi:plasmid stabilization system protein ParE
MARPVILMDLAQADLEEQCRWWAEHRSGDQAERWYNGFIVALKKLSVTAEQHAIAIENADFPIEIRQLNYGPAGRPTHRAIYTIRPDMILVLRVQHLAQDRLTFEDL